MLQLFASYVQFSQLHKWLNTTSIMIDDPLSGQPLTESLALPALCRKNQKYDQAPGANHNWSKSMDQPGCGNPLLFFPKRLSIQSPSLHLHLILGSMVILWLRAWPCKYDRAPRADHNYGNIRTPQYSQISIFNIILIKSNSECESSEFPVLQQIIWCFNFIAGKFALSEIECHANSIWHWKFCVQYFNICRFSSNKHMNALNCILDVGSGRIARALIKASLLFRKLYVASPL